MATPAAGIDQYLLQDDFSADAQGPANSTLWNFPTGPGEFIQPTNGGPGTETAASLPNVSNGALQLTLQTYNPTARTPGDSFLGSAIFSNQSFGPSGGSGIAFTAVARLDTSVPGVAGGIFPYAITGPNSHNEIDFESLSDHVAGGSNQEQTNIYINAPFNSVGNPTLVPDPSLTSYQTYTIEWFSNAILWLIDGQVVRETNSVPIGTMQFYLNMWAYDPGAALQPVSNPLNNTTYTFEVQSASVAAIENNTLSTSSIFQPTENSLPAFGADQSAGGWTSQDQYPRALADVNGDGKVDIVGFASSGVYVSLATGGGNFASPVLGLAGFGADAGGWTNQNIYLRQLADVNGDGKADGVGFGSAGVYVSLATGSGSFTSPALGLTGLGVSAAAGGWASQDQYPRQLADVNGDGKADIAAFGGSGVYVARANGDGTFASPSLALSGFDQAAGWTSQDAFPRFLADVTGNGKEDIVGFGSAGAYVALGNGNGTFAQPYLALADFGADQGWTSENLYPRLLADVNGDGIADIVAFGADGVAVALGNASGTFSTPTKDLVQFGAFADAGGWTSQNLYPRLLGDINGDGRADVVGFASSGVISSLAAVTGTTPSASFADLANAA